MYKHVFTIFTPSYNRELTLRRCYDSLVRQTFKNFEWLIVDDGSTDGTESLVQSLISENVIDIKYFKQTNSGKHIAINKGASLADGEFFLILDSDDMLTPDCLETLIKYYDGIADAEKPRFTGVEGSTCSFKRKLIGTAFPAADGKKFFDSNYLEIRLKYKVKGDKHGFVKTDIIKEFPFPIFGREKFLTEQIVWNQIALKYSTRFINESIYQAEYRKDGLTRNWAKLRMQNPIGTINYCRQFLQLPINLPFFEMTTKYANLVRFSIHAKKTDFFPKTSKSKLLLAFVALPVGFILYAKDKLLT